MHGQPFPQETAGFSRRPDYLGTVLPGGYGHRGLARPPGGGRRGPSVLLRSFAHFPRSAPALECLLADYFSLPIRVRQLQGQWLQLATGDQAAMPSPEHPKGLNNQLGVNLVAGTRVWDIQSKFRIQVGPLTYEQFQRFMPNGDALRPLCHLTRTYVGAEFDFDVQVLLRPEAVPWCQLGGKDAALAGTPGCAAGILPVRSMTQSFPWIYEEVVRVQRRICINRCKGAVDRKHHPAQCELRIFPV